MKNSGVEWIGEIPKDWEVRRMRNIGIFTSSGIDKLINPEEPLVKIINYTDVYGNESLILNNKDYMTVSAKEIQIKKNLVKEGDLIFTPSSETIEDIGVSALVNEDLPNTSYSYHVLRFEFKEYIHKNFKKYLCNNEYVQNIFSSRATGSIRKTLNRNDFKDLKVLIPPIKEQKKIAHFLDIKLSEIIKIKTYTKKSIEELKRYKQSLITEAVTKGLTSNVEMKDSGIQWVLDIPKHWETRKISNFFSQVKNKNDQLQEENLLSLSYGAIIRRNINSTDGLLPANFKNYNIVDFGDIVLRMTDLQNDKVSLRTGFVTEEGIITSAYITIRTNHGDEILPKYVQLYLHSYDIYKGFYGMGSGVRQNVTYNDIKKIQLLVPPLNEQHQIVSYIEEQTARIDKLIEDKVNIIGELESYKKSLIYEYVTGKKEV